MNSGATSAGTRRSEQVWRKGRSREHHRLRFALAPDADKVNRYRRSTLDRFQPTPPVRVRVGTQSLAAKLAGPTPQHHRHGVDRATSLHA